MKNNNTSKMKAFNVALAFLTLHLFGVHSKLLYHINPDVPQAIRESSFSFLQINEYSVMSMIFALAYSIMTVLIIKIVKIDTGSIAIKFSPFLVFALLDAAGVIIYYYVGMDNFQTVSAFYYGVYTLIIIAGLGLYRIMVDRQNDIIDDNDTDFAEFSSIVKRLKDSGKFKTQGEIAQVLNCSDARVSKILNEKYPTKNTQSDSEIIKKFKDRQRGY